MPRRIEGGPVHKQSNVEELVSSLLKEFGEDPSREGLQKTPHRVAKAYDFLTSGYRKDIAAVMNGAIFEEEYSEMVIVKDIDFFSMCEHHMLPFFGKAHVAYIPNGKIVGLSKIPRVVDVFARRLQVQERLTRQIADTLYEYLHPEGVGVVIEAQHMCMMMRGVEKQNSLATTSAMLGVFRDDVKTRQEFLELTKTRRI
ncbi:MAG: GTP cyclohydrolase I FolE [Bacteroidetes bacterium]|nr:GTP cyclohydrolase I FolE [Bacteroidota bacterium]MCW5896261.1 GTP cyclohydrolase I FolE [Bacteroidota bacterium]